MIYIRIYLPLVHEFRLVGRWLLRVLHGLSRCVHLTVDHCLLNLLHVSLSVRLQLVHLSVVLHHLAIHSGDGTV
jgi:hypothetical protein